MKKLTIEQMHETAKTRNGKCLSTEYVNSKTKLEWECEYGHRWMMIANSVRSGQWCPECAKQRMIESKRIPFEEIEKYVKSKGGRIASGEYIDGNSVLIFECKHNHQWPTKVSTMWRGRWCPICQRKVANKKTSHSIEHMHEIAKSRGGECLSTKYENSKTELKWKCEHGHIWKQKPYIIIRGQWCPVCYRDSLDDLQAHASKKKGKCLSNEYSTSDTKYKWSCQNGHEWEATWHSVKKGSWCQKCEGKDKKTLEDARVIALKRGGELLSTEYINTKSLLKWKCKNGHTFSLSYSDSKRHWCPKCRHSIGEEVVRAVLEEMLNVPFPKTRPSWLKNKRSMELDGFNEALNIAFEHQGQQHYRVVKRFHPKGIYDLERQQKRDELKRKLCDEHNVQLIEIPEYGTMTKTIEDLESLILSSPMSKYVVKDYDLNTINLDSIFFRISDRLNELKKCAQSHGGELLSKVYVNSKVKLKWKCKHGHIFEKNAYDVLRVGRWCPECSKRQRKVLRKNRQKK